MYENPEGVHGIGSMGVGSRGQEGAVARCQRPSMSQWPAANAVTPSCPPLPTPIDSYTHKAFICFELTVTIYKIFKSFRLPYEALIGGVAQMSREQFHDLNGYSNKYWGWGGEDDDMFYRIYNIGYKISRPPFHLGRYKMSFHHRDQGNSLNLIR